MRVSNLINSRGNAAANQFLISSDSGSAFQSYDTMIAFEDKKRQVFLSDAWDYSNTTLKHLKIFLDVSLSKKEIQKQIDQGVYKLVTEDDLKNMING